VKESLLALQTEFDELQSHNRSLREESLIIQNERESSERDLESEINEKSEALSNLEGAMRDALHQKQVLFSIQHGNCFMVETFVLLSVCLGRN
jgi:FtsZ-binding cell division protein ZapB